MMMPTIKVKKMHEDAVLPKLAHALDAGLDLQTMESVTLNPGQRAKLPTGLAFQLPEGTVGRIWPRSKLANHYGVDILAGVGDQPYRGELMISIINHGQDPIEFKKGDKIAQLAILPVLTSLPLEEVEQLDETERGASGINDSELRL